MRLFPLLRRHSWSYTEKFSLFNIMEKLKAFLSQRRIKETVLIDFFVLRQPRVIYSRNYAKPLLKACALIIVTKDGSAYVPASGHNPLFLITKMQLGSFKLRLNNLIVN